MKLIEIMVEKMLKDVSIDDLKSDDMMYQVFLTEVLEHIDHTCKVTNADFSDGIKALSKILYK